MGMPDVMQSRLQSLYAELRDAEKQYKDARRMVRLRREAVNDIRSRLGELRHIHNLLDAPPKHASTLAENLSNVCVSAHCCGP